MRISKSTHLKRLLQTQDTLVGALVYILSIHGAGYIGLLDHSEVFRLLIISPGVLAFSLFATQFVSLSLHGQSIPQQAMDAARFSIIVSACLLILGFVADIDAISRRIITGFGFILFIAILSNRLFLLWWYLYGRKENESNFVKILVIGTGNRARLLMREYETHSEWGIKVIGLLDPDVKLTGQKIDDIKVLGTIDDIHDIVSYEVVDEVIICVPRSLINNIQSVVDACQEQGICLNYMADYYDMQSAEISLEKVGPLPMLRFEPVARNEGKLVVKRIFDLMVALFSIPVLAPVFAMTALAIKFDSPGPVFFRQERVGLNKRIFNMIKFRSMCDDAESKMAEIEHLNEAEGPIFKMKSDPRITRVGKFIRRTSIDELPQILNVLLGHMSLIGPRPMSIRDVELFSKGIQRRRFSVRPGLLCLREISGRSDLSFERWLELDLKYIDEWSLWLDFKILLRAIPVVLKGSGAT